MIRAKSGYLKWKNPRTSATAAIAGMLVIFISCAVGPDYVRPKAEAPAAYKEAAEWKVAQPQEAVVRGAWWKIFQDTQLDALEEQVNISNQNVVAAEAQYRQARALAQAARAGYFPNVAIGASAARSLGSPNAPSSLGTTNQVSDLLLTGTASWEPDIWGKVRRTVEASQASAQASAADLESLRLSTQATLAQSYFQLCALDAQKKLLDATVAAFQKSLELTKKRYASGVSSRADVLQAETQLKTTQAQAIDVGVQRAQLEHAIALLVGKPPSVLSIPVTPLAATPVAVPFGIPSELLERRPDIAGAERRLAAANAQIGVAKAAYFPNIVLNATGGFESSHLSDWLSWPSRLWSVGLALTETVFDAGLRNALTDQARAAYDATVATYRQTVLGGFQEVEDNLAALRILEEESRIQGEAVGAARRSLEFSMNQYRAGTISYIDVVTVQTILLANEVTAINILGRRMAASVLLIKAIGGGWNSAALPSNKDINSGNNDKRD
ncbi:MAG: efflux transporter outer membrane subunit [Syntrophales bacterium]|jgi:NodT family efflux transporter outer membrane factor (OMF) lipoprotein